MNNLQFLLLKLAEEASEVSQIAAKSIQFGLLSDNNGQLPLNNKQQLHKELNDLLAIVHALNYCFEFGFERDEEAMTEKLNKVREYRKHSERLGLFVLGEVPEELWKESNQ